MAWPVDWDHRPLLASIDPNVIRELATGRYIESGDGPLEPRAVGEYDRRTGRYTIHTECEPKETT
jgi:hypothetical protein